MIMDISKDVWTKIRQKTERMDFSGQCTMMEQYLKESIKKGSDKVGVDTLTQMEISQKKTLEIIIDTKKSFIL